MLQLLSHFSLIVTLIFRRYHRMMLSRVKPLHKMVEQTRSALDEAVEKLGGMESKLRNLDNRMLSLSEKFEDASVDKSKQGLLTEEQQRQLAQAADFERVRNFILFRPLIGGFAANFP